jgi:hypothetical protein
MRYYILYTISSDFAVSLYCKRATYVNKLVIPICESIRRCCLQLVVALAL